MNLPKALAFLRRHFDTINEPLILLTLAGKGEEMNANQIHEATDICKTRMPKLLANLRRCGLVQTGLAKGSFRPTIRAAELLTDLYRKDK